MSKKIAKFLSYWKEVLLISIGCMTVFIIANTYFPDYENPFYPNKLRTSSEVMAERWPHPDMNDPNFLADFRHYMGFDFHNH